MTSVDRIQANPYWQMTLAAWLSALRMPAYSLPTLLFPLLFYSFFAGFMMPSLAQWMLATFATFGILGSALFSFGVGVAMERGQGWWLLLRASPVPFAAVVVGKMVAVMVFSLIIIVSMAWLAALFGVRMETGQWLGLALVLVLGTVPFSLLGLALGLGLSPNGAPAVINILYLPLGFLSGLWIPVTQLPALLQAVAVWLPPYHLAGLALHLTGSVDGDWAVHVAALLAYTVIFGLLASLAWRRFKGS